MAGRASRTGTRPGEGKDNGQPASAPEPDEETLADESLPMPGDEEPRGGGGVADMVRKALLAGVGAVFMTEEGIRKTVTDLKLPKEALSYLGAQAERTRTEAGRILRKEVRRFLNSDAFKQEIAKLVSGLTLEIRAEVRLKPSESTQPGVDAQVSVRRTNGESDSE